MTGRVAGRFDAGPARTLALPDTPPETETIGRHR